MRCLFITANVGSLFEENAKLHSAWLDEILKLVQRVQPVFIALHMQEVGGKQFEKCMDQVFGFFNNFYAKCSEHGFTAGRVYVDDDLRSPDFTALGSLYLLHKNVSDACLYNFQTSVFEPVNNFKFSSKTRHSCDGQFQRQRFPKDIADPLVKWSRKGFLRTRWKFANQIFDLVNIHLFHDACNMRAIENSPSIYSNYRKEALKYVLKHLDHNNSTNVPPLFIFGDFNFRLDTRCLVQDLVSDAEQSSGQNKSGTDDSVVRVEYKREASNEWILRLGTKVFEHSDHENLSQMNLLQFDKETLQFPDLYEIGINFPPSYPFCEDVDLPLSYMKTRAPAWCDRILMNASAWSLVQMSERNNDTEYDLLGHNVCMGDHKPVYLYVDLASSEGSSLMAAANSVVGDVLM